MHRGRRPTPLLPRSAPRRAGAAPHAARPAGRAHRGRVGDLVGELLGELLGATVGLLVAGASLALLVSLVRAGPRLGIAARPDDVLLLALTWVGVALAAWLGLGSLLVLAARLPGPVGRIATDTVRRVTPAAVRRMLTLVLGASMGSVVLPTAQVAGASSSVVVGDVGRPGAGAQGPGAAARPPLPDVKASTGQPVGPGYAPTAGSAGTTRDGTTGDATTGDPTTGEPSHLRDADPGPGYVPSAPLRVHDADRSRLLAPAPRVAAAAHDLVTVRRGDSLWSVAARHLGPGASDAEIAHEWPRWFAANRDVVGDDPDLLLPGQQLRPPGARR